MTSFLPTSISIGGWKPPLLDPTMGMPALPLLWSPLRNGVFILTDIDFYRWLEAPATEVQFARSGG